MTKKILVVLTSVAKYPNMNRATGLWLGEAVHFVKKVEEAGYKVDFVSPKGGYTPIDPHSLAQADATDWEWYQKKGFMNRFGTTLRPSQINEDDSVAIYYTGGHGVIWDFPENQEPQAISLKIYERGGFVSSVCHDALGLLNIQLSDGRLLIKDKNVTGFSNEEEKLVELDKVVPFLTETELVKRGAVYKTAYKPWAPLAVEDPRLITGRNPTSGGAVADLLIAAFAKRNHLKIMFLVSHLSAVYRKCRLRITRNKAFQVRSSNLFPQLQCPRDILCCRVSPRQAKPFCFGKRSQNH